VGFVLRGFALWALSNVEATGEAPIEAFVAWPSGLLSFGTLAVVAPVAEEVFFRGFVFGAIDDGRWGGRRALAFLLAWSLFALAHLQQVWGNWGGLLAVTTAGLVFTSLRALSGSTLVPALAHLVYNALLSVSVLTAALAGFAP
jgi:membrane protease YdiL (CAAX protease family)